MNLMTEPEKAWLAGLFEGEGCVKFNSKSTVVLVIQMTDLDILERVKDITGVGTVYSVKVDLKNKPAWGWSIGQKVEVELLIKNMFPWLGLRRQEKCKEALKRLSNNKGLNILIKHGTVSGYFRERKLGLETCVYCRRAQTVQTEENKRKRALL